ncbi:outer membrane beta-barrel family protein [uncultured Nonlabens sp.]|uniref:outer membrane beta-barrel family protein n=1 Tax=uncultured Nonlabens sp. TaxID=859306 RepID=UPI002612C273|nr:outer membrane beta-barrel family protein [uncultured Nonlabens sp.]
MKNIITLLFSLTAILVYSQNSNTVVIQGKLVDQISSEPLEFATISFISDSPNKSPQGGVTDLDGNYQFNVTPGIYTIKWEYITFKSIIKTGQVIDADKDYGTIALEQDIAKLDGVLIVAEKTTVDIRLDKKIYNIGKDLTVRGGSASDVLDNVPSVSVDVEGNVALRGNDNVTILIDGRPSALVGFNGAEALRQIPADAIEKIEVITSPSARYDAEGTAGILNIILRKNKLIGFNGTLQLDTGYNPQLGLSFNGNLRNEKWNFFTNTGFRYRETPGNSKTNTTYPVGSALNTFVNEERDFNRLGRNFFTSLGAEYFINDQSSIVANIVYRIGNDDDVNTNVIERLDENGNLNEATTRIETEAEDDTRVQYSIDYKNDLDSTGQKITASMQYSTSIEDQNADILETETTTNTINDVERTLSDEDEQNATAQMDYVLPIGEDTQFEAGYRGNYRDISNSFFLKEIAQEDLPNGPLLPDVGLNNTFDYKELVNAIYGQYGKEFGEFSFLAGLRFEQTNVTISQATTLTEDKKDYGSLFPTLNLGYEIQDGENITLGYNRRVRRPRGRLLNPFPSRSSESNVFQGNVDLDPTFTNSIDLGYLKRWSKFTFNTSVYYNRSDANWEFIQEDTGTITDNGDPVIRRTPVNLSTQERLGYELTIMYRPFKWWTINTDFNIFNVSTDGIYENTINGENVIIDFDFENITYFARLNQKFIIPSGIDLQTRLNYRGASANAQGTNEGIFTMNLAASKDVLQERATISINVSDLFNSRKRQSTRFGQPIIDPLTMEEVPAFRTVSEFQWRERQINLSFVYRFNQKKKNSRRGDGEGVDDFEF